MKEKKKKSLPLLEQFRHLQDYLILAGIKRKSRDVFSLLFILSAILDIAVIVAVTYIGIKYDILLYIIFLDFLILTLGYVLIFLIVWLLFLVILDYMKFKRKTALEEVLPEFLRLVSSNHRAGLPLDISLWKANRPRFGILSEEINEVAKQTYATGDLEGPLKKFGSKYDSNMLKRVISNLVEGLRTGADISSLLDDISLNITTIRNTRKELASEVENYMLFITITVLIISPLMFGLTYKMTGLIDTVKNSLSGTMTGSESSNMPIKLTFTEQKVAFEFYFNLFVYLMIATNSIISVLLMSMVKYGNVKQDLKKIPVYYVTAIIVYVICRMMFSSFLSI